MGLSKTYRIIGITLAIIFCLYIVGLPIVISACPMMKANHGALSCCAERPSGKLQIRSWKDNSCCKVTIAAKPVTTEFVSSKLNLDPNTAIQFAMLPTIPATQPATQSLNSVVAALFVPRHTVTDIPILTSSLLI